MYELSIRQMIKTIRTVLNKSSNSTLDFRKHQDMLVRWTCREDSCWVGLGASLGVARPRHREEERGMTAVGDVERLSVRGYQCHGCAAGVSCELLIYRP